MFQERRSFAPVREGDELDVKIEAVGEKGDGIAKKQGFVLFIAGTKTGDEVRVRVTKVLRNAGFAEVLKGVSPAKQQEAPKKTGPAEEDTAELEAASAEKDSEDFGVEPAEESPASGDAGDDVIEAEEETETAAEFDEDKE